MSPSKLFWRNWGIRGRLIVITLLPAALLFLSVVIDAYHSRQIEMREDLHERGNIISTAVAESSEYGLISGNMVDLERVVKALVQADGSIRRIDILDAQRQRLLHVASRAQSDPESPVFEVPVFRHLLAVETFGTAGAPHLSGLTQAIQAAPSDQVIGYVQARMSASPLRLKHAQRFQVQFSIAMLALSVSVVLALLLAQSLTRPMRAAIAKLGELRAGHYCSDLVMTTSGELGDLKESINELSHGLLELRTNLENKVQARTVALELSRNEALEAIAEKRKLIKKINSIIEEERKGIAIEIHDELNATLIALRLHAQAISGLADQTSGNTEMARIKEKSAAIVDYTQNLYARGRAIVRRLRPEVLDMLGLQGAIEEMLHNYNRSHLNCKFEFECVGEFAELDAELAIAAYRLVQEALSNVVKHASASKVMVALKKDDALGLLHLAIKDNGRGFMQTTGGDGIGIIGMRERIYAFSGTLEILSRQGQGATVDIVIPLASTSTPSC